VLGKWNALLRKMSSCVYALPVEFIPQERKMFKIN
jgi:hypothetical protein